MSPWPQSNIAVIPILVGPLQVLLALLPVILVALGSAVLALFKPRTIKLLLRLLWRVKVSVLVAVAVTAGLWWGVRTFWPCSYGTVADADVSTNDWPLFRGNPNRSGAVSGTESPTTGRINWSFTEVRTLYSSPSVIGNRIYITTADKGPFTDRGTIYCLDADTGGLVWKNAPEKYLATYSSPSVSGRYMVVGEGLHTTRAARIICLDVDKSGSILWTYTTKSHVESSPAIADGRVFIGAGDDGYYCFRLEPDAAGRPVMEWHLSGEKYRDAETSPAVCGGRVYFGLGVDGQALVCADAATGAELWRVATPSPVFTPPALSKGKVFIGMGHGNVIRSEEEVIAETREKLRKSGKTEAEISDLTKAMSVNGAVWCIDQVTNRVEWKFATDRTVLGGVAAAEDRVFAATRAGTVYALSFEGAEIARWNARVPILAAPALTEKCLYVVATDGRLYALDRRSLDPVWQVTLGSGVNYVSSPAVARGHVYVGTTDNGLLCVGTPGGSEEKPLWAGAFGDDNRCGMIDGSTLPDVGSLFWLYPPNDDSGKTKPPVISAPVSPFGNTVFVPLAGGERTGVACLDAKPGGQSDPVEKWFHVTTNGVVLSPVTDGSRVFFVDGSIGAQGRKLHCVDTMSGAAVWASSVDSAASGALMLTADALLVQDREGVLASRGYDGGELWRADIGGTALPCSTGKDVVFVAVGSSGMLLALDRGTGACLWQAKVDGMPVTPPLFDGDRVFMGTDKAVLSLSALDGSVLWSTKTASPVSGVIAKGNKMLFLSCPEGIAILDARDGTLRRMVSGALPGVAPLVTREAILYATKESLMALRLDVEKPVQWLDSSWVGTITAPPVMCDGRVFFASDSYGVVCAGKGR